MITLRSFITFVLASITGLPLAAQTRDDVPTCAQLQQDPEFIARNPFDTESGEFSCTIDWIENGTHRAVIWHNTNDEMVTSTFTYSEPESDVIRSQRPPKLMDMNRDGTLDLVTFTLLGMVNGQYDIYLGEPDTGSYLRPIPIFASDLSWDKGGMLVANSRNGARAYLRFYKVSERTITQQFSIDVQETCQIVVRDQSIPWTGSIGDLPDHVNFDPSLIEFYCNIYEQTASDRLVEYEDTVTYLPRGAVFYCQFQNGKAVTVSADRARNALVYQYGKVNGTADLTFEQSMAQDFARNIIEIHDSDTGLIRNELTLQTGPYAYTVYAQSRPNLDGPDTIQRGLMVVQDGVEAPIFDRTCLPETSYDQLGLPNHG